MTSSGAIERVDNVVHWILDHNSRFRANWLTKRVFMWGVRYFIRRGMVKSAEIVAVGTKEARRGT